MTPPMPPPVEPNPEPTSLGDHVRDLAWSPDGRTLAAALGSGEVVLVDGASGGVLRRWPAHKFGVFRVAWSSRSGGLASSGEDGAVRWWNPADGARLREHVDRGWVEHLAWSPDGTLLACAAGRVLRVWTEDGAVALQYDQHPSTISAMVWRGDGKGIGTACFGRVQLLRLGETRPYEDLRWKTSHVSLAWSPNGRHLAAGSQENTVTYWKLPFRDPEPLHMSGYPSKVKALAWDRESRWLATAGGPAITIWDVSGPGPSGTKPQQLEGHHERITSMAWQRAGDVLASADAGGGVWLWHPKRGNGGMPAATLQDEATALAWSPDEKQLAIGTAGGRLQLVR
jgi:WD40 repeat protein